MATAPDPRKGSGAWRWPAAGRPGLESRPAGGDHHLDHHPAGAPWHAVGSQPRATPTRRQGLQLRALTLERFVTKPLPVGARSPTGPLSETPPSGRLAPLRGAACCSERSCDLLVLWERFVTKPLLAGVTPPASLLSETPPSGRPAPLRGAACYSESSCDLPRFLGEAERALWLGRGLGRGLGLGLGLGRGLGLGGRARTRRRRRRAGWPATHRARGERVTSPGRRRRRSCGR
jgi:hypothetical protein